MASLLASAICSEGRQSSSAVVREESAALRGADDDVRGDVDDELNTLLTITDEMIDRKNFIKM